MNFIVLINMTCRHVPIHDKLASKLSIASVLFLAILLLFSMPTGDIIGPFITWQKR